MPLYNPVASSQIVDGTIVDADVGASAAIAESKIASLTTDLSAKAPLASPSFTGTTTVQALNATGNVVLGDAVGDTFKVHGSAGTGAQAAYVADVTVNVADVPGTLTALGSALNAVLALGRNHGLMAAS